MCVCLTCLVSGLCGRCHNCEDTPMRGRSLQSTYEPYRPAGLRYSSAAWHSLHLQRTVTMLDNTILPALLIINSNNKDLTLHILHHHAEVPPGLKRTEHGDDKRVLSKRQDVSLHKGLLDLVPQNQVLFVDLLHGETLPGLFVTHQKHSTTTRNQRIFSRFSSKRFSLLSENFNEYYCTVKRLTCVKVKIIINDKYDKHCSTRRLRY